MNKPMKYAFYFIALTGLILLYSCCKTADHKKYTIQKGDFQASLTETGSLQAVVAKTVVMPFLGRRYGSRQKITGLQEHGMEVDEGDSIIALDASNILRFLVERENRLELEKASYNKTLVQHS